jgi:hypothetical protein
MRKIEKVNMITYMIILYAKLHPRRRVEVSIIGISLPLTKNKKNKRKKGSVILLLNLQTWM